MYVHTCHVVDLPSNWSTPDCAAKWEMQPSTAVSAQNLYPWLIFFPAHTGRHQQLFRDDLSFIVKIFTLMENIVFHLYKLQRVPSTRPLFPFAKLPWRCEHSSGRKYDNHYIHMFTVTERGGKKVHLFPVHISLLILRHKFHFYNQVMHQWCSPREQRWG